MATKLVVKQNGRVSELNATQQAVSVEANAQSHFQLVDEMGNVVRDFETQMVDGNLWIDVPNTPLSPDFVVNNYASYFGDAALNSSGAFGANGVSSAVSSTVSSDALKASSVGATSSSSAAGFSSVLLKGLGVAAGVAAAVAINKARKDDNDDSGNSPTPSTNNNTGSGSNVTPTVNTNAINKSSLTETLHGNSIKLPTAYTKEILHGHNLNAITQAAKGGVAANQYQSSEADKKIIIADLNNLSREVQTELSLFVAGLLNPIRQQWGFGTFKVSEGIMNFAQDVANEYTQNGKSIFDGKGHYVEGIVRAAAKYGLSTGGNYYENMGGFKQSKSLKNITLDELKRQVYDSIVSMLFDDARSSHGHAKSLLSQETEYLGVDTSSVRSNELAMHFISVPVHSRAYIQDNAKFTNTIATKEINSINDLNAQPVVPQPNQNDSGSQTNTTPTENKVPTNTNQLTDNGQPNSGSQTNTQTGGETNNTPSDNKPTESPDTTNQSGNFKDILHTNSITLPEGYTKALLHGNDFAAIDKVAAKGMTLNQYVHSEADKKVVIANVNELPHDVQMELSLFTAGLLNPLRQKWNVGLYKVTDGAMKFAQDVANEYTDNNQSIFQTKEHYVEGISRAAAKYGLETGGNFYENMSGYGFSTGLPTFTLNDLKEQVYNGIARMLFKDLHENYEHAKALLNRQEYEDHNEAVDYLGVDISMPNSKEMNIHFIAATNHNDYIQDKAKFQATIETPEIVGIQNNEPQTGAASMLIEENNSHLATAHLNNPTVSFTPQKFVFSQLLDGDIRQLHDEYDAEDVLVLDSNVFTALNTDKSNFNQHINYESNTGKLQYDADGVGGEAAVVIAQLPTGLQDNQLNFEVI